MALPGVASQPEPESVGVRVEDYLNDKLQTKSDLSTVEDLIREVEGQQAVLQAQLEDAESLLEKNKDVLRLHATTTLGRAHSFQQLQADIDRRLKAVTSSEDSAQAVQVFQGSLEKLQRIEIATSYVRLLEDVENLSNETRAEINQSARGAIPSYTKLKNLSLSLHLLQVAAESAAPHLIDHVDKLTTTLYKSIGVKLGQELEAVIKSIGWPTENPKFSGAQSQAWRSSFEALLQLQDPELLAWKSNSTRGDASTFPVLLPMEPLAKPLELRFRYHFEGERPTNRSDKPEYFFSHVLGLISTYDDFLAEYVQPILTDHFSSTPLATSLPCADASVAFITSLLPMLRRKLLGLISQISSQPQLLSHCVHELISFDAVLRDEWQYSGVSDDDTWHGLTWEVLVKNNWFETWLHVEKEFALKRYHDILKPKDAFEIDYDSVDPQVTKPTKSAMRVNDLLETITDIYRPLPSFKQRLQFLIEIQVDILDQFLNRIQSALDAYIVLTSTLGRAVQGISKEEQASLAGVGGLERLCRVYGSLELLERAMIDWGDDIVFVELWQELRKRVKGNTGQTVAGTMSVQEVASRTSNAVMSEEEGGRLFDETSSSYKRLRLRTESLIVDLVSTKTNEALRPYCRVTVWSSLGEDTSTPTPELDQAVRQLTACFDFLSAALSSASLRRVARQVAALVDQYLWDNLLLHHSFSAGGVAQLQTDARVIWAALGAHIGAKQARLAMSRFGDGIRLLDLPVSPSDNNASNVPSLREVENQLFKGSQEARIILAELQNGLSANDARTLISRRVELGS